MDVGILCKILWMQKGRLGVCGNGGRIFGADLIPICFNSVGKRRTELLLPSE